VFQPPRSKQGIGCATVYTFAQYGVKCLTLTNRNTKGLTDFEKDISDKYPGIKIKWYELGLASEELIVKGH